MQSSGLRSSFQQLLVNHQVQTPSSNRNFSARRPARTNRSGLLPSQIIPTPAASNPWALQAVRADQATEVSDTAVIQQISDITRKVDELHSAALKRSADFVAAGFNEPTSELKSKVKASVLDLQTGLLERETEVRLKNFHLIQPIFI